MRNSITLKSAPDGGGCTIIIGNAGGGHGLTLTLYQMLQMVDWLAAWREAGTTEPFHAVQNPVLIPKRKPRSQTP